jgi:hypothetical protein
MNFGLLVEVISASAVVVLRHTEIGIYYFACPTGAVMHVRQSALPWDFPLL